MLVTVKLNEKLTVSLEASDQKDFFRQVSSIQEVCGSNVCQACKSENTKFCVRNVTEGKKTFEFFEIRCQDCRARLSFGSHQEGDTLFPKKKNGDTWLENGGWEVYKPQKDELAKSKKKADDTPF